VKRATAGHGRAPHNPVTRPGDFELAHEVSGLPGDQTDGVAGNGGVGKTLGIADGTDQPAEFTGREVTNELSIGGAIQLGHGEAGADQEIFAVG